MTTMNDLFDRYDRECIPKIAPRSQRDYRRHLDKLRAEFGTRDFIDGWDPADGKHLSGGGYGFTRKC